MSGQPVIAGLFDPPIAPSSDPIARHCSSMGAVDAAEKVARQSLAILALYQARGPLTDQEVADALGIQRNSVNARRAGLIAAGLIDPVAKGTRRNEKTGISNAVWGPK